MIEVEMRMNVVGSSEKYYPLGNIEIANKGTHPQHPRLGNYEVRYITKDGKLFKTREIKDHPRNAESIWKLMKKVFEAY